ncbi:hypothetical protein K1T71_011160 [Dendrolimus kikuchii]|uniref:Uncharacterized protein n=1 Tax=Dendrolimus kikuchii TaxID=765133 RepID=A0ACC1CMZ4_9NEOP|nr:hypothetical protein K1T71_011160 [Dendrolimus kikuchii]
MEKQKVIPFYELCRLCLEQSGAQSIFDIIGLSSDIFKCTGVQIIKSNQLPAKICIKCYEAVQIATHFRLMAQKNEAHLRLLFPDETEVTEQVYESRKIVCSPSEEYDLVISSSLTMGNEEKFKISVRNDLYGSSNMLVDDTNSLSEETKEMCSEAKRKSCCEDDNKEKLLKKIKVEDEQDGYVCGECSKMYMTWKKLYLHQRSHNKNIPCPLDLCGKKFTRQITKNDDHSALNELP